MAMREECDPQGADLGKRRVADHRGAMLRTTRQVDAEVMAHTVRGEVSIPTAGRLSLLLLRT